MTEVQQRNAGVPWGRVVPAVVVPLLVMALVVPLLPPGYSWQRWLLGFPAVAWLLFGAVQPLIWWWGAALRVDEAGLHFGTREPRRRPAQVTFAARNPYDVPFSAMSHVRLVQDRSAVAAMCKAARRGSGAPQPTTYLGYLPARGRAALAFEVDGVAGPQVRDASTRSRAVRPGATPGQTLSPTATWAFPVARAQEVLDALRERGVVPVDTDQAVLPGPVTARPPAADDPFVLDVVRRNLGREPTEAELEELRRKWHDTDTYPEAPRRAQPPAGPAAG